MATYALAFKLEGDSDERSRREKGLNMKENSCRLSDYFSSLIIQYGNNAN